MESGKKSNKILDIVRLQQILKKWKKIAATNNTRRPLETTTSTAGTKTKNISPTKFLKKTLSFSSDNNGIIDLGSASNSGDVVPKGYLAVCVGRQEEGMQRFVIPTEYLGHQAFAILLREAEEEFGFQQEGILKIPCDVPLFHNILKMMQNSSSSSSSAFFLQENVNVNVNGGSCCSYSPPLADSELNPSASTPQPQPQPQPQPHSSPHLQLCR